MDKPYRWEGDDLFLQLHLQTRAKQDEVAGFHGDALKIKIKAPPVEGKANDYLIRFLAEQFDVCLADISLIKGHQNRNKLVRIFSPKKLPDPIQRETQS